MDGHGIFLAKTSDPERALQNLLQRDSVFTDRLRRDTKRLELRAIEVHCAMDEDDSVRSVAEIFDL